MSLGSEADDIYNLKQKLKELNTKCSQIKLQIKEKEIKLLENLQEQEIGSIKGKVGQATIMHQKAYVIKDWNKFITHMVKKGDNWQLLEKRVSTTAVKEYKENNPKSKLPGLGVNEWDQLRVSKA